MTRDEGRCQTPKPLVPSHHSETGNSRLGFGSQARKSSMNDRDLGLIGDLGLRAGLPKGYARQMRTETEQMDTTFPSPDLGTLIRAERKKEGKQIHTRRREDH